jgi:hypothetical protein
MEQTIKELEQERELILEENREYYRILRENNLIEND